MFLSLVVSPKRHERTVQGCDHVDLPRIILLKCGYHGWNNTFCDVGCMLQIKRYLEAGFACLGSVEPLVTRPFYLLQDLARSDTLTVLSGDRQP